MYFFGAKKDGGKPAEKLLNALSIGGEHVEEIEKNLKKALECFQDAARQDHPLANFMVAHMLFKDGRYSEAIQYYKKAGKFGVSYAEYNLGMIYRYGLGDVSEDLPKAVDYFNKAVGYKLREAYYELGDMYYNGEEVPEDKNKALQYWRNASDAGYAPAQYKAAKNLKYKGQDDEANKLYLATAEQGYAPAQVSLGIYYSRSKEQEKKAKAMDWFNKAAEQGNAYAQWLLGDCYSEQGDEAKAKEFYEKAAQQGSAESQYRLSKSYYRTFKEEDVSSAWKWCLKAVEQGHVDAQRQLAEWYETCYGVSENYVRAYTYYYLSYLCGDETYKTAAKYDMERLRKEIEDSVWWSWFGLGEKPHKAKVSQSQAEEAKKEADKLYDAIQKRIKHAKRQNAVFRQLGEDEQQDLQKLIDETKTRNWKDKLIEDKKFFVKKGLQFLWTLVVLGILIWLWLSK